MVLSSLALVAVLLPLYGTLLWSVIISLLFRPLYRRALPRLKERRTLAALSTMLVVVLVAVVPFVFLTGSLLAEAADLYNRMQSAEIQPGAYFRHLFDALPWWVRDLLRRLGVGSFEVLQARLVALLGEGSRFIAARALGLGQDLITLVVDLFIVLYVSFFLIRDGDVVVLTLREGLPLTDRHQRQLIVKFTTVIRATVKGNLVVAALQGALGGAAFWYLDVPGSLLWGVVMAFLSLLPALGSAIVWLPVVLYFLSTGATASAMGLLAWSVLVIGVVDNLLRPLLVGKDIRLPDFVVLLTTLGGLVVFGINGFVLGPVIAAMFLALWHIAVVDGEPRPDDAEQARPSAEAMTSTVAATGERAQGR